MSLTTPQQFRASVDSRLQPMATKAGRSINRIRTLLVMERFLARMVTIAPDVFVLKGGLALELRLPNARTTRDLDVLARADAEAAEPLLRRAAELILDPPDHLAFTVQPNPDAPEIDGDGVRYKGRRFRVTSRIAARPFGDPFGVDVAVADPIVSAPDVLEGSDFFERYGLSRVRVPAYPIPSHISEKLHAYTLPRSRPNSRVKDLVDLALLAELDGHSAALLRTAIDRTFTFRGSHGVPTHLPNPPDAWEGPYVRMRDEERLTWATVADVMRAVRMFLDPILAGSGGRWDASARTWID